MVGNYTLNIYNSSSIIILKKLNLKSSTISHELDEAGIINVSKNKLFT